MTTRGPLKGPLECEYVNLRRHERRRGGKPSPGKTGWATSIGPSVLVRNINGHTVGVQPGWTVARWGRHRRRDRQSGGSMGGPGGDGMSFGASAGNSLRESRWPVPSWAFGICP